MRPTTIFDEYPRLVKTGTETFFTHSTRTDLNCPTSNMVGEYTFNNNSFDYCECKNCRTLFVSHRPDVGPFSDYYSKLLSSEYLGN